MGEVLVIDSSVGVKLVLPEEGSEAARNLAVAALGAEGSGASVPDLFFPECANALRKGILRYGLSPAMVERGLRDLCTAGFEPEPTRDLVGPALELARAEGISLYDAVYVALSDRTGAALVTADRRLFDRLAGTRHRVRWLGEFAPGAAKETPPGV